MADRKKRNSKKDREPDDNIPADKPVDKPVNKPVDKPVDKVEKPINKPVGRDAGEFFWGERTQRRTVRGGIRSHTSRGAFGTNWWARRWIQVLESFHIGGRLGRGKTYARQGQVVSIEISEGEVAAAVQGSRQAPYLVKIKVKTIDEKQWAKLNKSALSKPIVAAKLLGGEMPEDIEQLFAESGASLFPSKANDLTTSCSCPDWSNPCKHIAAVYYLLGEEFDRDPFLIFRLRGMSKEKLVSLVLQTVAHESPVEPARTKKSKRKNGEPVPTDEITPDSTKIQQTQHLPVDYNEFWSVHLPHGDVVGSSRIPAINASLPKRLGNLPFWRVSESLADSVDDVYKHASQQAQAILAQDE